MYKKVMIETKAIKTQIKEILVISENVSKKSTFCFWVKPFATNLALYLSIKLLGRYFLLELHMQLIGFTPRANQ
jgi:hypothetical protein